MKRRRASKVGSGFTDLHMPRSRLQTRARKVKRRAGNAHAALPDVWSAQKAEVDPFGGGTSTSAAPVTDEVAVVSGPGAGTSIGGTAGAPPRARRGAASTVVLRAGALASSSFSASPARSA